MKCHNSISRCYEAFKEKEDLARIHDAELDDFVWMLDTLSSYYDEIYHLQITYGFYFHLSIVGPLVG